MRNWLRDTLPIFAEHNRLRALLFAALLIIVIPIVDRLTAPEIFLGFLYLFPIVIAAGFVSRVQIVLVALLCAILQEMFNSLPREEAEIRLLFSVLGFAATGLFISELALRRRRDLLHLTELRSEVKLREDAEAQLRLLIESNPAAIVTIAPSGEIVHVNEACQRLLAPDGPLLPGQNINSYLPALSSALQGSPLQPLRTVLQGRGQRSNGETFLASAWFSTYGTVAGPRLTAILVDLSEDLCNREDLSLNYLLKNMRILMGAFSHEVRNLCAAALVVHKNLSEVQGLKSNDDFRALGAVIQNLQKLSSLEHGSPQVQVAASVDLSLVLDELRVLIGATCQGTGIKVIWAVEEELPMVWADRYGLLQVFLNLANNSRRAMEGTGTRQLRVSAREGDDGVVIRLEDTGVGLAHPEELFRPFHSRADSSGFGLFVSQAIVRSFGGDLRYEPVAQGCCFAIVLPLAAHHEEVLHA
jgi:two-component system, LuxR family, sensor kinase FixL